MIWLLGECPDALRADFQRVYQLNLDDLGGSLDIMHAADLTAWLPSGSAVWIATDSPAAWGIDAYLTAGLWDSFNLFQWGMADKKKRWRKPKPIPRPGGKHKHRNKDTASMTPEQLDRFLSMPRRAESQR